MVKQVITNVMDNCLPQDKPVHVDEINELANTLTNEAMRELLKLKKLFKYSVTVLVQQKNGSPMNYGGASYMEDSSDGSVTTTITDHPHVDVLISIAGFKVTQK